MIATTLIQLILAATSLVSAAPMSVDKRAVASPTQSAPFGLYVTSSNATLNGSYLHAGHSGAAIEQLIVGVGSKLNKTFTAGQFNFNVSSTYSTPYPNITGTEAGELVWTLRGGNFNESEPLSFQYNPYTDDALALFEPSVAQQFYFKNDTLIVVENGLSAKQLPTALDRWYACDTPSLQGEGYTYFSIHWALGSRAPENKSCQKVSIKRTFY